MVWHISRPERLNALGTTLAEELAESLRSLKQKIGKSQNIAGLIISAEPCIRKSKAIWIAGGDLKELSKIDRNDAKKYSRTLSQLCYELERLPIPVIAIIDGAAIGGGAELALAADIRIGTERTTFNFKQLEIGLTTGYGGAKRLCHLIGRSNAQKLLFTSYQLTAKQAVDIGVLTEQCSIDSLDQTVNKSLKYLSSLTPNAFATQKKMLWAPYHLNEFQEYEAELEEFTKLWGNPDHQATLSKYK